MVAIKFFDPKRCESNSSNDLSIGTRIQGIDGVIESIDVIRQWLLDPSSRERAQLIAKIVIDHATSKANFEPALVSADLRVRVQAVVNRALGSSQPSRAEQEAIQKAFNAAGGISEGCNNETTQGCNNETTPWAISGGSNDRHSKEDQLAIQQLLDADAVAERLQVQRRALKTERDFDSRDFNGDDDIPIPDGTPIYNEEVDDIQINNRVNNDMQSNRRVGSIDFLAQQRARLDLPVLPSTAAVRVERLFFPLKPSDPQLQPLDPQSPQENE